MLEIVEEEERVKEGGGWDRRKETGRDGIEWRGISQSRGGGGGAGRLSPFSPGQNEQLCVYFDTFVCVCISVWSNR